MQFETSLVCDYATDMIDAYS